MAIEDAITNDPAIERHGSEAAAKYMAWHWAALSKAVAKGDPCSCVLTESRQSDDRLYGCFRASISEPVDRLDLKTPTWRDLLTCMAGRVVDFSFMTLLRPDPSQSYEAQRSELLVVPRAQFVMVELARQRKKLLRRPGLLRQSGGAAPVALRGAPAKRRRRRSRGARGGAAAVEGGAPAHVRVARPGRKSTERQRRGGPHRRRLAAVPSSRRRPSLRSAASSCGAVAIKMLTPSPLVQAASLLMAAFEKEVLAPQNKTIRDSTTTPRARPPGFSGVDVRHRAAEFVAQRLGTCEAELADDDRGVGTRLLRDRCLW